ncbi:MAG: hypothetical protein Q7S12_02680 [bacterium]|nr:hypothetical protein [bacterium]
MMNNESGNNVCKCPHHKMVPVLVVLFGLTFLLGALDVLSAGTVNIAWPILVVLAGLMKMMTGACKCCDRG